MLYKIIIIFIILVVLINIMNFYNNGYNYIDNFATINKENSSSNKKENSSSNNKNINKKVSSKVYDTDVNSYEKALEYANKNNTYYYNDVINQTNIVEDSNNIIHNTSPIDYSNVKTGMQKCLEQCKGGCYQIGYDGIATCYPYPDKSFEWGTLYKNPLFSYGTI